MSESQIVEQIRREVLTKVDVTREVDDREIQQIIANEISEMSRRVVMTIADRRNLETVIFNSLRKMDVLQELLEDDEITEIMINGSANIFYEKMGQIFKSSRSFYSNEKLEDIIQQVVGENNKIVNEAVPIVDTRLKDGSRVNIVLPPIAIDGAAISIRKFPKDPFTIEKLIDIGSLSSEMAEYLNVLVKSRYNIFVSGGTGSGKTTFLNVLSNFIPKDERIITIEDSAELQIKGVSNLVRLETRNAGIEGNLEISIRDLIKSALRMRPDRVIVGECRGAEALDMLQAMNTGHDGSLSTGHANSTKDMIARLETMVLMGMNLPLMAIRSQIAAGIDILIHLGRLRDRSRRVLEIAEVDGLDDGEVVLRTLCKFIERGEEGGKVYGEWVYQEKLKHTEKLLHAGLSLPQI